MEPRPKHGRRNAAGSVAGAGPRPAPGDRAAPAYPRIESIIYSGGQIMIGTIAPIAGAAVAHDGKNTLAMLRCQPQETLPHLLQRLEAAIVVAQATGQRVDELNRRNADQRYEL